MFQMCSTAAVLQVGAISPIKLLKNFVTEKMVSIHVSLDERVELVDRLIWL